MAIATGTAIALGVAAGTAVGGVAAAKAQSSAAKHAADIQAHSTSDALAYQKEQDAYLRSRYEKEDAREDEARRGYQQYLASMGKGPAPARGVDVGLPGGWTGSAPLIGQPAQPTLSDMAPAGSQPAAKPDVSTMPVSTKPTLADLGKWNEWDQYLNPQQA